MKSIKSITLCIILALVCALLFFVLTFLNGSLVIWLIFILGFVLSSIHLVLDQSPNVIVRFTKLLTPLVCLFILSYMVYVEYNYPKTAVLLEMTIAERGFKFITQLDKITILNFLPRFFSVLSLKFLVGIYATYSLGSFLIKHLKYKGYTEELFSETPSDDGNLVRKHLKRKTTKFKRRF